MKSIILFAIPLIALLSLGFVVGCNDEDIPEPQNILQVDDEGNTSFNHQVLTAAINQLPIEPLSSDEESILKYMREEEKLARDVYITLGNQWAARIFDNISESEATHMAAVKILLDRYELGDPAADQPVGTFTHPDLQALSDSLISIGQSSLIDALKVGATIEEVDIIDLTDALEYVDNQDIRYVFDNLMKGSRNHLRAFVRNLNVQGETYVPQYLDQASYDAIINSPTEHGPNG